MKANPAVGVTRRQFLATAGAAGTCAIACPSVVKGAADAGTVRSREALFWKRLDNGMVQCGLCPWSCRVPEGMRGRCGVREHRDGGYHSLVYGYPVAMNNDPIEKKPLFHVAPGSRAFSMATVGCNIACKFCQNWDISQQRPEQAKVPYRSPDDIVALARGANAPFVAYTYNEPTVFYEYMLDCAKAVREAGLRNVVISNGFIQAKPLEQLAPYLTAMKVDLKSFSAEFYRTTCNGQLAPVRETLKRLKALGVWFEIVTLIIPTLNDDMDMIRRMAGWIAAELGPDVPLFFSRFHAAYKIRNLPRTPVATIRRAGEVARAEGLHFVYAGNMPGARGEDTCCPGCGATVVERYGHTVMSMALKQGACVACGQAIAGVWA